METGLRHDYFGNFSCKVKNIIFCGGKHVKWLQPTCGESEINIEMNMGEGGQMEVGPTGDQGVDKSGDQMGAGLGLDGSGDPMEGPGIWPDRSRGQIVGVKGRQEQEPDGGVESRWGCCQMGCGWGLSVTHPSYLVPIPYLVP